MVKRTAVLREPGDVELHRRGIDRLVFFSDAVIVIAITLIVLPLVDDARNVGDASVWLFLHENSSDPSSMVGLTRSFVRPDGRP